ncbi:hypothetical protein HDZ31DRAFT_62029 [Schizophyllum fasciatum]
MSSNANSSPPSPDPGTSAPGLEGRPAQGLSAPDGPSDNAARAAEGSPLFTSETGAHPSPPVAQQADGLPGAPHDRTPRFFGIPNYTSPRRGGVNDYKDIYPEDEYGAEAGPNARVWRVYLDESGQFDDDMILSFRDTLDVHLIFAGLFSAVVTTMVVQTSQALSPNFVNLDSLSYTSNDVWVNALWFTTLVLSLVTVLIAALVKQWLQEYIRTPPGPARDRALIRQVRYDALLKWKVPLIVNLVPLLLHVSLALFLAGLVVFLRDLSSPISSAAVSITATTYSFYIITHIVAALNWRCSYRTPSDSRSDSRSD